MYIKFHLCRHSDIIQKKNNSTNLSTVAKIITIIGAGGVQGSGVMNALLKDKSWQIQAVTRTPESEKAQALLSQGVEVVTANLDDAESLIKVFRVSKPNLPVKTLANNV